MSEHYWQTDEFKQLNEKWAAKLKADDFDDIERPPPKRPNVPESRYRSFYKDYLRSDLPGQAHAVPLHDVVALEDCSKGTRSPISDISIWDSKTDAWAEAVHRYEFKSRKDRQIVESFLAGETHRQVMKRLRVGRPRIRRVLREVREFWLASMRDAETA